MMKKLTAGIVVFAALGMTAPGQDPGCANVGGPPTQSGEVIISEIMYNPDGSEPFSEWVELYNPSGGATVDISGYRIMDPFTTSTSIPAGTLIAPGEAVILTKADVPAFLSAWDSNAPLQSGYQVFSLSTWPGLNNTGDTLTLIDSFSCIVDIVDFDDSSPWPSDNPDGASIYLCGNLDAVANDSGSAWSRSVACVDGAHFTNITLGGNVFGSDQGSPGFVAQLTSDEYQQNQVGCSHNWNGVENDGTGPAFVSVEINDPIVANQDTSIGVGWEFAISICPTIPRAFQAANLKTCAQTVNLDVASSSYFGPCQLFFWNGALGGNAALPVFNPNVGILTLAFVKSAPGCGSGQLVVLDPTNPDCLCLSQASELCVSEPL